MGEPDQAKGRLPLSKAQRCCQNIWTEARVFQMYQSLGFKTTELFPYIYNKEKIEMKRQTS